MTSTLRIASVSSEVSPFSKAGGLADVSRSLPRAFTHRGHRAIIVTPLHGVIDRERHGLRILAREIPVTTEPDTVRTMDVWTAAVPAGEPPVYFIDRPAYFSSRSYIYGAPDENRRFLFFNRAVLALLEYLRFAPDVIQCHDWQSGLIPYFLRRPNTPIAPSVARARTLFTIHNLTFQLGHDWWTIPAARKDGGQKLLPSFDDRDAVECINFAKRAILHADAINAVSPQYAREILTKNFGQDLHRILQSRQDRLYGILNGIDYDDFNPATDPGLAQTYTADTLERKVENKLEIQRRMRLPVDPTIPLIGMVSRITEQKGFDLLLEIADSLLRRRIQVLVLGGGDPGYEARLRILARRHPKRVACHLEFNTDIATLVYAGSDMLLMPSHFEPSGLGQMIALRYGAIPIVRATGGLVDSVTDYNPKTGKGNG
ncbi:MAG: glycogen synthase, partial [Candidatus Kerfeldbacteria bacterium]|nr:glycogen synthase [Candidatus Kerfeldbacteria bacterium]